MAVIKQNRPQSAKVNNDKTGLSALTLAALTLPGLSQPISALAYEEESSFSYGHYQEGKRDLAGKQSSFSPIEVDSLQGSGKFKLTDRIKFAFNYQQDTWGGATPVVTAPLASGGNGGFTGSESNITTGATPLIENSSFVVDKKLNFYRPAKDRMGNNLLDSNGNLIYQQNNQLVHTLSLASPEVRKQGDFKLSYDWDDAAVDVGGGISIEDDYESRFGSVNTRWDFNQKQTTLNVGLSYTNSDTHAIVDHDAATYFDDKFRVQQYSLVKTQSASFNLIEGSRQDWSASIGLTQVLTKNALMEANLGFARSTGYMANPYKGVTALFVNPDQSNCFLGTPDLLCAEIHTLFEQRPEERNQWNGSLRLAQYIEPLNAALHAGYRVFSDDWGVTSHTFDADWVQPLGQGWSVTPRLRYYSQDAADFYTPILTTRQTFNDTTPIFDDKGRVVFFDAISRVEYFLDEATGIYFDTKGRQLNEAELNKLVLNQKSKMFDRDKIPSYFSSDQRLSGYGALSGGVTVTKQFAKGMALDLGFEYYSHQGSLKIGGGGENSFADFDYWSANAALRVNLEAMSLAMAGSGKGDHAHEHHHEHGAHAPAGVMFDHLLPKADQWMVGYRYIYSSQGGTMLNANNAVGDLAIVNNGCPEVQNGFGCFVTPTTMQMSMHMLDIMYAPTDWLTLMLMPQFMDMSMDMRRLDGAKADSEIGDATGFPISQHIPHHIQNGHETGGIGDLGMYALIKIFDNNTHHLHITPGFSAPTGDVDIELRRNHQIEGGFIHYGMQLGSGTWDFKPSLTYTGHIDDFSWGAQASGTVRMEDKNKSGYRLGDMFQATAWGSYNLLSWLTASVRGLYTTQGSIKGAFTGSENGQFIDPNADPGVTGQDNLSSILKFGTMDYPGSYGGRFWDVGFGLSAMVPSGPLAGNQVSVEWLHPVYDNVNGYQLEREGSLSATWSTSF